MEPSINEVEKALKYVVKEGLSAGKHARDELRRIAEWQNLAVTEIHALRDGLKVSSSKAFQDVVKRELKLAKLIYKHDLKKKMKWRRIMKLAQNLCAWSESTRSLIRYGRPIELMVKIKWDWVCDAINHREGYEVYRAVLVNDAKKEMKTFFGLLNA